MCVTRCPGAMQTWIAGKTAPHHHIKALPSHAKPMRCHAAGACELGLPCFAPCCPTPIAKHTKPAVRGIVVS